MFSKAEAILNKINAGVPISEIVDVGVQACTPELIRLFPNSKHHLFEINPEFNQAIAENYKQIDHDLHNIGLHSLDKRGFVTSIAHKHDGVTSHSRISDREEFADGRSITNCVPVDIFRFDSLKNISIPNNFLLKVDVDGADLDVIEGFGEILKSASLIVIEAATHKIPATISLLQKGGFRLTDIVDIIYYGDSIWQCDLIFINNRHANSKIFPEIRPFQKNLWRSIKQ